MKETLESCLTGEKVLIKFYRRRKGNITDNPKHVANGGMLQTATKVLVPPRLRNGQMKNILLDSEKDYLEKFMHLPEGDLSIYNKKYWGVKSVTLGKEDNIFDLSDPDQFIKYKIAVANSNIVAPSIDNISERNTYLFYIEKEGEQERRKVRSLNTKQLAYKYFGKYEDDRDILRYILKECGKPTAKNTKLNKLQGWVGELIDDKTNLFIKVSEDSLLKTKVFLELAIDKGLLTLREDELYNTDTDKPLSQDGEPATIHNAAIFINEPRQQEYRLALKASLKNSI